MWSARWAAGPGTWAMQNGAGLIGLLVLAAAVTLTVTGTYPRLLFDVILGLDRWTVRVAAYAALMTDTYPPFRLDIGGQDPADPALAALAAHRTPHLGTT